MSMRVRRMALSDVKAIASLRSALWPDGPVEEHEGEVRALVEGRPRSTLPLVVLVAEVDGEIAGFVEVGLRSHADGCDPRQPVGFIEGWYTSPVHRGKGIGRALVAAAEDWSR